MVCGKRTPPEILSPSPPMELPGQKASLPSPLQQTFQDHRGPF